MARAVIGDVKGIDLKMTVTPGQDSHSFEPTPSDVIQMENADVLIYNGGSLETWIDTLLDSLNNKNQIQMKMMDYVDVLNEEIVEGMDTRFEEHDHDEHSHKDDNHNKEKHKEDSHSEENIRKIITVKIVQMIRSFIMKIQKRNTKKQMNIYGLHLLMK